MRRGLLLVALTGCWHSQSTAPDLSAHVSSTDASYVITETAAGPFDATSVATREGLQSRAPGLRVALRDLGQESGIVFNVYADRERLFYVVPDDAPGYTDDQETHAYAKTVFGVFAMSPKVRVQGRSWRVGQLLDDVAGLDRCECWGDDTVTTCFHKGSHIRLVFEANCHPAAEQGAKVMIGTPIGRIMWKRELEPPVMLED